MHEKRRDYNCEICGLSFGPNILKRHTDIVHLKLKPHKCEECGKAFGEKTVLNRHMKTVHEKHWDCA